MEDAPRKNDPGRALRGAVAAAAAVTIGAALAATPEHALAQQPVGFSEAQRTEIAGIKRDAMRSDLSILREALKGREAAARREHEDAGRLAVAAHAKALFHDPADPVIGNPAGTVTVVEFFDPRCSFCKRMSPVVTDLLRRQPDVRWVMKDLPILGPNSVLASHVLLAAQMQGRYAELQNALMKLREEPTESVPPREAERVGLYWVRLQREMSEPAIQQRIEDAKQLAQALRLQGTPAFVVGKTLVPGAVDLPFLERLVADARAVQ